MRTVHKFPLPFGVDIKMPRHAVIRHFALQAATPTIWAEVDIDAPLVSRRFQRFGTGHPLPGGADYVGTYEQGPFVWHVYEVQE